MRKILTAGVLVALGAATVAADDSVRLAMPDTGLAPSFGMLEATSRMGERHGASSLGWSTCRLTIPFTDPRKSKVGMWRFNACLETEATFLDTAGDLDLRRNELYNLSMPLALIRPDDKDGFLALGVMPTMSSDFAGTTRGWDVIPFARCKVQVNKQFSYSLGLAASPRFAKRTFMPLVGFSWTPSDDWEVRLERMQLSALYSVNDRLKVGPFAATRGGMWMVDTEQGERLFRISSAVVGVTAEYDFHKGDEPKRIIFATLGATTATRADFCNRAADKRHYETHHYKPGLHVSAGVDFRF